MLCMYVCRAALRITSDHRRLHYSPAQIQLIEKPRLQAYLSYEEDISKANQDGLTRKPKFHKEVRSPLCQHTSKYIHTYVHILIQW